MRIFVVDAFTDRAFAGNPAGVCPLSEAADPAWMQSVAAELKHSETAFSRPLLDDPGADFELRWFTPAVEVALCGHATLATAHVLYETGAADGPIRFRTVHSGILTVRRDDAGLISMDFPAMPPSETEVPAEVVRALGLTPRWGGRNAQTDILVVVDDPGLVRGLGPDLATIAAVDARGVCVTAPGDGEYDFVSRFFGPRVGVSEDPVTGSAHCMLGPYWADRLGRTELLGYQASPRGGEVRVQVRGDRVVLGGRAVTVLSGDLLV